MRRRYVIVGSGAAGSHAALEIRKHDPGGSITLIGEEPHSMYHKYAMMDYLCGRIPREDLFPDPADRFVRQNIHLRLSQPVVRIEPENRRIRLAHKEHLPYDRLLIATGVRAAVHPTYRPFFPHLTFVNSLEDVEKLRHRVSLMEEPLILGGSLTAIRLAVALRAMGKPVDYLLLRKMTGNLLAGADDFLHVRELLADTGARVLEDVGIGSVSPRGRKFRVSFEGGMKRSYSCLFAGFGVQPNTELARRAGIACDQGILVNEYFETGRPGIFAAGDAAQIYHPRLKDYWVNFGWPNAVKQGALAGRNMCGEKEAYRPERVNVLALGGREITFRNWQ